MQNSLSLFQQHYPVIQEHRKIRNAPVDQMGTGALAYPEDLKVRRFQILVSTMLSSQTKDEKTFQAVQNLQKKELSIEMILSTSEAQLAGYIQGVRFAKRKANYLKETAKILKEQYELELPKTLEELTKLPGVGKKMALIVMLYGWGECLGIAVDTHVHRVVNRLGWVQTEKADQTQIQLEQFVPKKEWEELGVVVLGFGQQICSDKKPRCSECKLNQDCFYYLKEQ